MKKIVALALAIAMVLTCSLALADRLDDIKASGKLTMATSPDWPPYEYLDEEGNIVGTEILMAQWLAEQLGVELVIEPMNFDACLAAVATGKVDIVLSGLTYDEERTLAMELIGVYWDEGDQGLLVRKGDAANYKTAEDFTGKTVAAQNGTLQLQMVEEQLSNATLEVVSKIPDGVNMLVAGRVDALAVPKTVYDSIIAENDQVEVAEFGFEFDGGNYLATVKGEEALAAELQRLVDQINEENLFQQWVDQIVLGE